MNRTELIKKLLPGFIPLFVFIAADEIWGTQVGLIVALAVGCIELAITYWREKRFDRFVLIDTALLLALGGISILLDNDIFFKLKPAIIEGLLCAVLGLSAFTKFDLMGGMTQRYLKGIEMTETIQLQFKKTLKSMFWIFSGHTLLVLFSAFFMSKEAWAFISGGLFYILFAVYFLYEYRNQKKKKNTPAVVDAEEWLPVVDEKGAVTGKALRSACHNGSKWLHPVVHLHVLNASKHIYLQKRPENKLIQPGKWDTAVGGHIAFGENLETALNRESWEEIGLKDFNAKLVGQYVFESDVERELVFTFITHDYKGIHLHTDEVTEGKFWSPKQIEQNLGKDVFTPNFELEYRKFFIKE